MKWLTATVVVALALATNSCANGQQHDITPHSASLRRQDDEQKNKFLLTKEDAKDSHGSKFENEEVLVDTSPLLPKEETHIEKSDSVGIPSNDKESITSVYPDQTLSIVSQDVEDHQVQAQGRRLDEATFEARCEETSGGEGFVDCVDGFVRDTTTTCADACKVNGVSKCCTGFAACGEQSIVALGLTFNGGFTGKVCKDNSCSGSGSPGACFNTTIPYVVGPSCTGRFSCAYAKLGSVDSSCNDEFSCAVALLSGVDLTNSCKKDSSCFRTNGNGEDFELVGCCNEYGQCFEIDAGLSVYTAGCPAPTSMPPLSLVKAANPKKKGGKGKNVNPW